MLNDSSKLHDHFPWDSNDKKLSDLEHEIILCEDDKSMASDFTFTYLLVQYLNSNCICHMLCTNSSVLHYEYILRKAGLDIEKFIKENLLRMYCIDSDTNTWIQINSNDNDDHNNYNNDKKEIHDISDIMTYIIDNQQNDSNNQKEILLIDELNNLELLCGIHDNFIIKLFNRNILNSFYNICSYASSIDSRIVKYYSNIATINIRVAALTSGYSLDVHGVITVSHNLNSSTIYFKQQDGNVFCFQGETM